MRSRSQADANIIFGLFGAKLMSTIPVSSLMYNVFVHDFPPFVVLKTPRSSFFEYKCPKTPTTISLLSVGFIQILEI